MTLAACGSSMREMATYGRWEYEVLDECFEAVDLISLHTYFRNPEGTTAGFLENIDRLDAYIGEVTAIADAVAATRRSSKRIGLSLDEWNVWYKAGHPFDHLAEGFPEAPRLIEEVFDAQDAVLVGGALIVMLGHAARLRAACTAQLCNVIAPILTEPGGPAWRQTIFHPFAIASRLGRGEALRLAGGRDMAATREGSRLTVFALNRDEAEPLEVALTLRGLDAAPRVTEALVVGGVPADTVNDADNDRLAPRPLDGVRLEDGRLLATLPPLSWAAVALDAA